MNENQAISKVRKNSKRKRAIRKIDKEIAMMIKNREDALLINDKVLEMIDKLDEIERMK